MRFRDKVAVVTGAGSGFGRATAARLGEEGANVVVVDVDAAGAHTTVELVQRTGGGAELVVADISTVMGARTMVEHAVARFGGVDILVNNAGISQAGTSDTWNCAEEVWDRVLQVDLKSVYLCSRAVIPEMRTRGRGSIVNISSVAAHVPCGGAAYSAAKAGMMGFTRCIASELAPDRIRINCVAPGYMRSPMSTGERAGLSSEEQDARIAAMGARVPMGHSGVPMDIAEAVLFLASDEAGYITGHELVVDGGYLVR